MHSFEVEAILFDMDGTLVDSTRATDETFRLFVERHGLDLSGHPHGVRMSDSMKLWFPNASEAERTELATQFEADIIDVARAFTKQGKQGIRILPGVERLLAQIRQGGGGRTGEDAYAICTSATRVFASSALSTAGITTPKHLLTADDCQKGKPDAEPYLRGAAMLPAPSASAKTVQIGDCLVFEDAPAGIRSGVASGAKTIAVCTSHSRDKVSDLGADLVIDTLEQVQVEWTAEGRMRVTVQA